MEKHYKQLTKPFPKEAITDDTSRGFTLTSIKAQYVVERLNEVFGVDGWQTRYDIVRDDANGVVIKCQLDCFSGDNNTCSRQAFGGSKPRKNIGDTFKSACTESLCKAASHLGIGNEIYKGNANADTPEDYVQKVESAGFKAEVVHDLGDAIVDLPNHAPVASLDANQDPGDWVFTGGTYKDQAIKDIPKDKMVNWYKFMSKKDLIPNTWTAVAVDNIRKFYNL